MVSLLLVYYFYITQQCCLQGHGTDEHHVPFPSQALVCGERKVHLDFLTSFNCLNIELSKAIFSDFFHYIIWTEHMLLLIFY